MNHSRSSSSTSDLDWQAFQYIAGELSSLEAEQFEQQLADDQSAREAVARAVKITQAVATSMDVAAHESAPIRAEQPESASRRAWPMVAAGLAVAAGLLLFVQFAEQRAKQASNSLGNRHQAHSTIAHSTSLPMVVGADHIVAFWTEAEMAANEDFQAQASLTGEADEWEFLASELALENQIAEVVVPNWLITAVPSVDADEMDMPNPAIEPIEN